MSADVTPDQNKDLPYQVRIRKTMDVLDGQIIRRENFIRRMRKNLANFEWRVDQLVSQREELILEESKIRAEIENRHKNVIDLMEKGENLESLHKELKEVGLLSKKLERVAIKLNSIHVKIEKNRNEIIKREHYISRIRNNIARHSRNVHRWANEFAEYYATYSETSTIDRDETKVTTITPADLAKLSDQNRPNNTPKTRKG